MDYRHCRFSKRAMKSVKKMTNEKILVDVFSIKVPEMKEIIEEKVSKKAYVTRDDAFIIINLAEIHERYQQWKLLMPRVEPFYALKCNNDPVITRFMGDLGLGFDCASKREIQQVLDLGVAPDRIVYANTVKQSSFLDHARESGVHLMTFDDIHELDKIKLHCPDAKLLLRLASSKEFKAFHNFNKKFGCHPDHSMQVLQRAKELGLNVVGLSFHAGSKVEDATCFASAIEDSYKVFGVAKDVGFEMTVLDIGGGYPGNETEHLSFVEVAEVVTTALDKFFPPESGVRIIAEPGRYFVSAVCTLVTNVIARKMYNRDGRKTWIFNGKNDELFLTKDHTEEDEQNIFHYYINEGIHGFFRNILIDNATIIPYHLKESCDSKKHKTCIWGPTCDPKDCVVTECHLPLLGVGDWIYFRNMGAYTLSAASNFNSMDRPTPYYVCDGMVWNEMYAGEENV